MPYRSELVGFTGAFDTLKDIEQAPNDHLEEAEVIALLDRNGVDDPPRGLHDFAAAGVLHRRDSDCMLTPLGERTYWLLELLNGGDLVEVFDRLGRIDTRLNRYEVVREGMTDLFIRSLIDRPGFGRVYLCSPWINLSALNQESLERAVALAEDRRGRSPEIVVMTRPKEGSTDVAPDGVKSLRALGATIFLHNRLHTKLYMREPDTSGGYSMAIVGSQNLTLSSYFELGIRVNADARIINQLLTYFWSMSYRSIESTENGGQDGG